MVLALIFQLFVDGAWTTYPAYSADGWTMQIGPDVETGVRPTKLTMTLANADLSMDPTNVTSALYGKIGRNTPIRLRINATNSVTWAEASSWQPDTTVDHDPVAGRGRAWVDVTAEGLLRRLSRWTDPIASPMRRQIGSYASLTGYAPLEDPSGAATLAQVVPGAPATVYAGSVSLGGDDGPGGSDKCLTVGSGAAVTVRFKASPSSGWQVCWAAKLKTAPTSATAQPLASWVDSLGRTWAWTVNNTRFGIQVNDSDGTLLTSSATAYTPLDLTTWVRFRVRVTVAAGTITYEPAWYNQDGSFITGYTATFSAASTGQLRSWTAAANAWTTDAAYAHAFAVTDTTLDLVGGAGAADTFDGYLTERAGTRFLRLLAEQGLTGVLAGSQADTVPMGRQKPGLLLDLLTECAVTDGGLLYDTKTQISLSMRTRRDMINRTPALTLARTDLAVKPRLAVDDVGVANVVTVTNADGSTAVAQLTAGRLSTQVPPAGVGTYKAGVDVNQANVDDLPDRANWEMRKGTLDRPRYLEVVVNLFAHPTLTDTVTNMLPGDWIALAGIEPDPVSLRVISWERKGDAVEDTAVFSCLPAELWQVAVIGTSRIDSASTTLSGALTTTATTVAIATANPNETWSTTSAYDLMIAGERIGVPAGGMSAPSGTGPYTQTITGAVRSKNGVVKAQSSGAEVHLADPVRIGL